MTADSAIRIADAAIRSPHDYADRLILSHLQDNVARHIDRFCLSSLARCASAGRAYLNQAGVCAFSLTSRITQRDGTTGRDAPGSRTLLYPGEPGTAPAGSTATFTGARPPAGTPAYSMIPGWRPPPGPGSPGVRRHPADSRAIPEPGPRARRHPGVPAGLPFTPCAVTLDQLHRQGDGPGAAGTTDGDASAPRQSRKTWRRPEGRAARLHGDREAVHRGRVRCPVVLIQYLISKI
jgi:hypothetical protein